VAAALTLPPLCSAAELSNEVVVTWPQASKPAAQLTRSVPRPSEARASEAAPAPAEPTQQTAPNDGPQPPPASPGNPTQIPTGVPPGFEADAQIETVFDVDFQGRSVGSFTGRLANGVFRFTTPAAVAAALGDDVNKVEALTLLGQSLSSNESLRCLPGQTQNCDLLPVGTSGIIVNPDSFRVHLFLGREFFLETRAAPRVLGEPVSGPSLIQGALVTASTDLKQKGLTHVGATFDTEASLGRTSLVSQVSGDDITGFQLQQGYLQHVRANWLASAGLLTSQSQTVLTSVRYVGADVSSQQTSTLINPNQGTPLDVVLPRKARVELYANGTLVSAQEYDGGLQLLDTGLLPTGSYTVRIIARDGATVLLDQTRPFTRAGNLPPPGKFVFDFAAGERVSDFFTSPTGDLTANGNDARSRFIPQPTGEKYLRGQLSHRIGAASAATLNVFLLGSNVYSEVSFQTYRGLFNGLVGAAADTHGDYSLLVTGGAFLGKFTFALSARVTRTPYLYGPQAIGSLQDVRYLPFGPTGESIYGSTSFPLLKGTLSLTASYAHQASLPNSEATVQYSVGLRYDRSVQVPRLGSGLLSVYASASSIQTLVGLKLSFFTHLDRQTSMDYSIGGEYAQSRDSSVRQGGAPVGSVDISRAASIGPADVVGVLSASNDSQQTSVQAEGQALSRWGSAQLTAGYQTSAGGAASAPLTVNIQSGFVVSGGDVKFGLRSPGQAIILAEIERPPRAVVAPDMSAGESPAPGTPAPTAAGPRSPLVASGSYRVSIDGQTFDSINVGEKVAVPVGPYRQYRVTLQALGAPTYDFDLTPREVPVYPGNVIVLRWKAKHVTTIFGRLVDQAGRPLSSARIDAGTDTTVTDAEGYFVVTGPDDGDVQPRLANGQACKAIALSHLHGSVDRGDLLKVGDVVCQAQ